MELSPALAYPLAALMGYALGSIPFGLLLTRAAGLGDIRAIGSGNIGATNVLRTGRKDIAFATLLLDSGKAALALFAARVIFGEMGVGPDDITGERAGLIAGGAAFLGHCYPLWLSFKGGKGVATFFGTMLVGLPFVGIAAGATWILTALIFRMSSLAALAAAALAPVYALALGGDVWEVGFCVGLGVLIFVRHEANIQRILRGNEPRIGAKKPAEQGGDSA